MQRTADERAARALAALVAYTSRSPIEQPDEAALCDLLTDAMHLFGESVVHDMARIASTHYAAEAGGDE